MTQNISTEDFTNQQLLGTSNCISLGYPYTVASANTLSVEKLPGGFIVTVNGQRRVIAGVEALAAFLQGWADK